MESFYTMYHRIGADVWEYIEKFNKYLKAKVSHDDSFVKDNLIKHGKDAVTLLIHEEKLNTIANKYLNK